ncbi:Acyl transferase [Bienertia sinuspersici]
MVRNFCKNSKLKSARRRPLRDVSNGVVKSTNKKLKSKVDKQPPSDNQDPLDRLLLVHSDISSLLRQIDELVVEAVNVDTTDNEKITEIKSFTTILSEIHFSLKPWVPRLQRALTISPNKSEIQISETSVGASPVADQVDAHTVDTPEQTKRESLVSPSPLVSWRATECAEEKGKQLFLLTPLVRARTTTSKPHAPPKLATCEGFTSNTIAICPSTCANDKSISEKVKVVSENLVSNSGFEAAQKVPADDIPTAMATPCLKNPLKTYVLHDPDNHLSYRKIIKAHISTPFPTGNGNVGESTDSESSSGEVSEKLGLKYPELIGLKPSYTSKNGSRALDASPAWIMSPPKCCKLLEPLDEKHPRDDNTSFQELARTFNQQMSLAPPKESITTTNNNNNQDKENKKIPLPGNLRSNIAMVESTPLWKGSASTIHRGKRPGENTLKRELWTRFEAASTNQCQLNLVKDTSHKGFLERLEEASCDVDPDAFR